MIVENKDIFILMLEINKIFDPFNVDLGASRLAIDNLYARAMLYNADLWMNATDHIRDLTACPRCKTASLCWEAARIECTSCGQIFSAPDEIGTFINRAC